MKQSPESFPSSGDQESKDLRSGIRLDAETASKLEALREDAKFEEARKNFERTLHSTVDLEVLKIIAQERPQTKKTLEKEAYSLDMSENGFLLDTKGKETGTRPSDILKEMKAQGLSDDIEKARADVLAGVKRSTKSKSTEPKGKSAGKKLSANAPDKSGTTTEGKIQPDSISEFFERSVKDPERLRRGKNALQILLDRMEGDEVTIGDRILKREDLERDLARLESKLNEIGVSEKEVKGSNLDRSKEFENVTSSEILQRPQSVQDKLEMHRAAREKLEQTLQRVEAGETVMGPTGKVITLEGLRRTLAINKGIIGQLERQLEAVYVVEELTLSEKISEDRMNEVGIFIDRQEGRPDRYRVQPPDVLPRVAGSFISRDDLNSFLIQLAQAHTPEEVEALKDRIRRFLGIHSGALVPVGGQALEHTRDSQTALARRGESMMSPAGLRTGMVLHTPGVLERVQNKSLQKNVVQESQQQTKEDPKVYKAVFVEAKDAIETAARDLADRRMTEEKEKARGLKGIFVTRMMKHGLFREFNRQREIAKARAEILESGSLYAHLENTDNVAHKEAMRAVLDRFASEYEDRDIIHEGESRGSIDDQVREDAVKTDIRALIERYVTGQIDQDSFVEEKNRIIALAHGIEEDVLGNKLPQYADNLLDIAESIKITVEHGKALEELDLDLDVIVGQAKMGVRTEAQFSAVDRVVEKIQNMPGGTLINEATAGTIVGLGYSLSVGAFKGFARSKLAAWGTLGLTAAFGAGLGYVHESHRMREDRRQHAREMAISDTYDPDQSPRRVEMQEYLYEMRSATELANNLEEALYTINANGEREVKPLSPEEVREVLAHIAAIESRIQISDEHDIDLLSYSDAVYVEEERTRLDILRAQAKIDLRTLSASHTFPQDQTMDQFLTSLTTTEINVLLAAEGDIKTKDAAFNSMRRSESWKKAGKTLVAGLAIGVTLQEVSALLSSERVGVFESIFGGNRSGEQVTTLEGIFRHFSGEDSAVTNFHEQILGKGQGIDAFKLPEGYTVVEISPNVFEVVDDSGVIVMSNLAFGPNGEITKDVLDAVNAAGFTVSGTTENLINVVPGTGTVTTTVEDYVDAHKASLTEVQRVGWYDNDTVAPTFDQNELDLWWGGKDNAGIITSGPDAGKYEFTIAQMDPDGSFHKGLSADAQALMKKNDGSLKMLLSLSRSTQSQVFEVPISPDGKILIDPATDYGKLMFETEVDPRTGEESAKFIGKYAEIAQVVGEDKGVEQVRILATHVGDGLSEVPGDGEIVTEVARHTITLDRPTDYYVEPPWFVPIIGRTPLEPTSRGEGERKGSLQMKAKKEFETRVSMQSELRQNPDANLNHAQEAKIYFESLEGSYTERITTLVSSMEAMHQECKLSICVPIVNHSNPESVSRLLESYLEQTANQDDFEVVLFVAHPEGDTSGVENTQEVIERFKKEHPGFPVRTMTAGVPQEVASGGRIRKMLHDAVLMRSEQREGDAGDVIMVANEVGMNSLESTYVSNYIEKFEAYETIDAMVGQVDIDNEAYLDNPLLHTVTRFLQYTDVQERRSGGSPNVAAANFAIRGSMYAAVGGYAENQWYRNQATSELGERVKQARRGATQHVPLGFAGSRASRIYAETPNGNTNDENLSILRQQGGAVDFENADEVASFVSQVEDMLNKAIESKYGSPIHPSVGRALGWLGIKYDVTSTSSDKDKQDIRITDASKLVEGLKRYQEQGVTGVTALAPLSVAA